MKIFFDDIKTIWKTDREFTKRFLKMTIASSVFLLITSYFSKEYLFSALILIFPCMWIYNYKTFYYPALRDVEKEVLLEQKYSHMYNKFIKSETGDKNF